MSDPGEDTYYLSDTNDSERVPTPPVEIPVDRLSSVALEGLIDAFILREGTDYGAVEISHETKQLQVRRQLDKGHVKIVFDPDSESVTLLKLEDWEKLASTHTS
jgi:uncharacterized protein YheU (UPF0270 family)